MSHLTLAPILASAGETVVDVLLWLLRLPVTIFRGYSWLLETAAEAVRSLFESYGYWVIFLGTLFENTLFLGLFLPGVLIVVLAGLHAEEGMLSWPVAVGLGVLGTVIGDTLSYMMGRFGWARLFQGGRVHEFTERIREPLLRRGQLFVLVYHFAGYTRVMGPAAAGMLRMPYRQWAPADYTGAALWITTFMGVGYGLGLAGVTFDSSDPYFRYVEWGLLAFVLIIGLYMYWKARDQIMGQINRLHHHEHTKDKAEEESQAAS